MFPDLPADALFWDFLDVVAEQRPRSTELGRRDVQAIGFRA